MYTGVWWGNLRGKKPRGRPRHRWEDNVNMHVQEMGWVSTDWIELAQNWWELEKMVLNLRFYKMQGIS